MADNTPIIAATVKVDAGQATGSMKDLNININITKESLSNIGKTAGTVGKDIEGAGTSFGKLRERLSAIPGPAGEAVEGVNKLSSVFKLLATNPLVITLTLIVGALTLLYKAFTNTFAGAEKVEQVFAGVRAAAQALFDDLSKIGSAIVKFFTFDFSGAADEIKSIVSDVGKAYDAMSNLTKQAQELHKEQLQNDLEQAERQKRLAILREQANDDSIPRAQRKKALEELKADAVKNAADDIALAKKVTENKIAQLELEKDGYLKNRDEINRLKIEQINVETDNANELRRIDKQLTAVNKQEEADRVAAAKDAAEKRKQIAADLAEYQKTLLKLQQENELLGIKDAADKERKQLENKIADQKKSFDEQLKARKINQAQYDTLVAALTINSNLQEQALVDKHIKEVADKEAAFQKELADIKTKISLDGIKDQREKEFVQLEIGYEQKLQEAIKRYKDDQVKFLVIKNALDEQLKADQQKLEEKNLKEDQKKAFAASEEANQKIIDQHNFEFDAKKAALDAQTQLVQDAFDQQIITEQDYNAKTAALAEARKSIKQQEAEHNATIVSSIAGGLNTLSEIAGKQTAVGKALAIASTTISTYQSAIGAFKGMVTTIPGPVGIALGVVAAAGALATGIAAVKKIVATKIPVGGDVGGSAPTGLPAAAAPITPTQQSTKIDQSSIKGIGDATAGRTYVLDADVQSSADRNARLNRAARLGGG